MTISSAISLYLQSICYNRDCLESLKTQSRTRTKSLLTGRNLEEDQAHFVGCWRGGGVAVLLGKGGGVEDGDRWTGSGKCIINANFCAKVAEGKSSGPLGAGHRGLLVSATKNK